MRLQIRILFILIVFLEGCAMKPRQVATQAAYDNLIHKTVGQDVNWLIAHIGPPSSTYDMPNGNIQYIYDNGGEITTPIVSSSNFIGDKVTTTGGDKIKASCRTMFIVDKITQKVISSNAVGNACITTP